ncbi:MAG: hypothetical protein Kow0077_25000 [Anaerolineae bacterium]
MVDMHRAQAVAEQLRAVCRSIQPFSVVVDHYGIFPGRVLYLGLADPAPVLAVYHRLLEAFPEYPLYAGEHTDIVPHITIAVVDSAEALESLPKPAFQPFEFTIDSLHFMVGNVEVAESWETIAVIPLGGK